MMKMVGRLATYLQVYGDLMVRTNRWDPAALQRFRRARRWRAAGAPSTRGPASRSWSKSPR